MYIINTQAGGEFIFPEFGTCPFSPALSQYVIKGPPRGRVRKSLSVNSAKILQNTHPPNPDIVPYPRRRGPLHLSFFDHSPSTISM